MINTILGNIASILEKNFLFAFFLPVLLFATSIALAVVVSVGPDSAMAALEQLSATRWAWISSLTLILLVAFAYVLSALREAMTQFWSGAAAPARFVFWGWYRLGTAIHRRRYQRLRTAAATQSGWIDVLTNFEDEVRVVWHPDGLEPDFFACWLLRTRIRFLDPHMSTTLMQTRLRAIVEAFRRYNGQLLTREYEMTKRRLSDWDEQGNFAIQECAARLDRSYGALATVKPTRLGNVIDSYNYYAYKRYKIQADLLWPRLQYVIAPAYSTTVQDAKVLLDFGITMATLAAIYAALAALAGPWLAYDPILWSTADGLAVLVAWFSYGLSVKAALQYGDRLRSSFDMFRLDLLKQFGIARPAKLSAERDTWEKLSQLVVYGTEIDLDVLPEKTP